MPFEQTVVSDADCPRCNAKAKVRITEERDKVLVLSLVCPKCKLVKYSGLTTRRGLKLRKRIDRIQEYLDKAHSKLGKAALEFEKRKAEQLLAKEELGL